MVAVLQILSVDTTNDIQPNRCTHPTYMPKKALFFFVHVCYITTTIFTPETLRTFHLCQDASDVLLPWAESIESSSVHFSSLCNSDQFLPSLIVYECIWCISTNGIYNDNNLGIFLCISRWFGNTVNTIRQCIHIDINIPTNQQTGACNRHT